MRCCYLSDLHLESQDFSHDLSGGDVLIVAGDLCHAACLDPGRTDLYAVRQRERVLRFADMAVARFRHVLMVAGNHDHYDGVFEDTVAALQSALPGFTLLDDASIVIDRVSFFGTTLWSDFEAGSAEAMEKARRGCGEYFFAKTRVRQADGTDRLEKLRPHNTLAAHRRALSALESDLATFPGPSVVISHHAPSLKGLNPFHAGNGLDGAYASNLEAMLDRLSRVSFWVHGHTHIVRRYRLGEVTVLANCRGFADRDPSARKFRPDACFDVG